MRSERLSQLERWPRWLPGDGRQWQRLLIILVVLLLSGGLAVVATPSMAILVMALPVAVAGALLLLRWPAVGILLLITANLIVAPEIYFAVGTAAVIVLALTALWLIDMLVIRRELVLVSSRTIYPLFLLVLVSVLAFLNGQLPWYPITPAPLDAQIGGILIFVVAVAAFLLVAHQVRDVRWLKWIVFLFLGLGSIMVMGRLVPVAGRFLVRLFPFQVASGSMFWTWLIVMAFSQAAFNRELDRRARGVLAGLALGALYITLGPARAWVSGWFPAVLGLLVTLWVAAPGPALIVSMIGGVGVLIELQNLLNNLLYIGDNAYSQTTRLEAWRIIAEIVKVSPFLGLGPANYSFYTPLFPILGYYIQFNSHNNYVDIIAQTGILGLLCLLWFIWEIGKLAWALHLKLPPGTFLYAYVVGCIGGIVATFAAGMLGDWFLPYVYNATIRAMRTGVLPWLFMGGLVAVQQILAARESQP